MKTTTFLMLLSILLASSCKKDDAFDPVDQLPPATQIGAGSFGCLVDGELFIPKKFGINRLSTYYQYIDGKYNMVIGGSKNDNIDMNIQGLKIDPLEVREYDIVSEENGKFNASYILILTDDRFVAKTSANNPGKLTISNFDSVNFIISGTFEFTVLDNNGKEIKITDGRFDVHYTN